MIIDPCNLGRVPISLKDNPLLETVLQIIENDDVYWKDTAFYNYHATFRPKTLAELYSMKPGSPLDNLGPHTIFLPWYHFKPVKTYSDTSTLIPSKKVLFDNKDIKKSMIVEKIDKLKNLIKSFRKNGYDASMFNDRKGGKIRGFLLSDNSKSRFYVASGNHRVAVFLGLYPGKPMPAGLEEYHYLKKIELENCGCTKINPDNGELELINTFDIGSVKSWPSVRSKFLTKSQACEMFNSYMGE